MIFFGVWALLHEAEKFEKSLQELIYHGDIVIKQWYIPFAFLIIHICVDFFYFFHLLTALKLNYLISPPFLCLSSFLCLRVKSYYFKVRFKFPFTSSRFWFAKIKCNLIKMIDSSKKEILKNWNIWIWFITWVSYLCLQNQNCSEFHEIS